MTPLTDVRRPSGVIHDIGYQRYTGPRLGRGYAVARRSTCTACGPRSGWAAAPRRRSSRGSSSALVVRRRPIVAVAIRSQTGEVVADVPAVPRRAERR